MLRVDANLAAAIPPNLAEADEVLTRYGRWAMDRRSAARCGSAERDYVGPRRAEVERDPRELLMPPWEAMAAHRALIRVPDVERVVLHVLYVPRRLPPATQLRLLGVPPRLSQLRHLAGLRMFNNLYRLSLLQSDRRI